MTWAGLEGWWREEVASDVEYEATVAPMVLDLLGDVAGLVVLDAGCGDGRVMAALAGDAAALVGVDISHDLLSSARMFGHVFRASLPSLAAITDGSCDAAFVCLVIEHVEAEATLLSELGRVVRPNGTLALVANHPMYTAPGSAPIQEDDEVLWRPGEYFGRGQTDEKAGDAGTVRFHHRTTATLLTAASAGGWDLERLIEKGATESQIAAHPPLADQRHIPRLLGARWRRR